MTFVLKTLGVLVIWASMELIAHSEYLTALLAVPLIAFIKWHVDKGRTQRKATIPDEEGV